MVVAKVSEREREREGGRERERERERERGRGGERERERTREIASDVGELDRLHESKAPFALECTCFPLQGIHFLLHGFVLHQ